MEVINWRAVDPYLQRPRLIFHLRLDRARERDLPAKLAAVLDWSFLAARLSTWNDAGQPRRGTCARLRRCWID